eukprot:CAMPEP_0114542416 /NCGR_PEP_ID=MMETSP0114-20121206/1825_1 /TAXON_ID=31324 /ORGANISM="Goniomonas sp, Strain m" /LENGTH=226 /DNA_ID=CAMNT_0001726715 /DNA_START=8 /DNA_END=688 /DNA_ORIENTATION=+
MARLFKCLCLLLLLTLSTAVDEFEPRADDEDEDLPTEEPMATEETDVSVGDNPKASEEIVSKILDKMPLSEEVLEHVRTVWAWMREQDPYQGVTGVWFAIVVLVVLKRAYKNYMYTEKYGGVGMIVDRETEDPFYGLWRVTSIAAGSDAAKHILPRDLIHEVDGKDVSKEDSLIGLMRGVVNTTVLLTVSTPEENEQGEKREVTLRRKIMRAPLRKNQGAKVKKTD